MRETPKRIKHLLRELGAAAYAEELRRALLPLAAAFRKWEQGQFASHELADLIHRFHDGPAREIYSRYDRRLLEPAVAFAIASGILDKTKTPPELLQHLSAKIKFYESAAATK